MSRIMIIDDEDGVRESLGVFSEILGHEPILVKDPAGCGLFHQGSERCDRERPCSDVQLIDQTLPRMHGLDFVERKISKGCKIPARCKTITAGRLTGEEFQRAKKIGCHVLQKPVTFEILERWLSGVVTARGAGEDEGRPQ